MVQKRRRTWFIWTGTGVLVVALLAMTFRSAWSGTRNGATRGDTPDYPEEFRASESRFTTKTSVPGGVERAIDSLRSHVMASLGDLGLSADDKRSLVDLLASRVRMHLAPDFDQWRRLAGEYAPAAASPSHPDHAEFRRVWTKQAETLRKTSLDLDSIIVRRIEADAGPRMDVPGTIFLRSGGPRTKAARFPDPPRDDPNVEVYEILIPMQYRISESESIPTTVSYRFYRTGTNSKWRPTDLYLYFGREAFGKGLPFPIN